MLNVLDMTSDTVEDPDAALGEDRSLLIVDDDKPFLTRLARAMESRGFTVETADADDIYAALTRQSGEKVAPPENPMSADRVRWEHIQRVYEMCDRNVSETARRLNMHRRTLQRILAKRAPR
mgnify:CR=1 FL=1